MTTTFRWSSGSTLDVNDFVENLGSDPGAVDAVFVGRGGIEGFDVKILDIGAVIGEAPGDAIVVADDDEWSAGESDAFGVIAWSAEMNFVPDGRDGEFEMGVVGE